MQTLWWAYFAWSPNTCQYSQPVFFNLGCVFQDVCVCLCVCVCVLCSHSAVKVPRPLRLTFSLWSVARMKAEHQSKMFRGSALSSWTSSSTGDQKHPRLVLEPPLFIWHDLAVWSVAPLEFWHCPPPPFRAVERHKEGIFNRLWFVLRAKWTAFNLRQRSGSWVTSPGNLPGEYMSSKCLLISKSTSFKQKSEMSVSFKFLFLLK